MLKARRAFFASRPIGPKPETPYCHTENRNPFLASRPIALNLKALNRYKTLKPSTATSYNPEDPETKLQILNRSLLRHPRSKRIIF